MVKETAHLLNYLATHLNATVCYRKSNMILYIHSDVAYMVLPEAWSRAGGHFYLSIKTSTANAIDMPTNGTIHNECSTICNIMGTATEAEVCGLYVNCQQGEEFHMSLQEIGHPQPP
eukprot:15036799-Ditylum_brightwellii.AAC.1